MSHRNNKNVRKKALVDSVAEMTDNTQVHTGKVIERFLSEVITELKAGNKLEFRGFGVFEVVTRKQKIGRNPRTNEEVLIPEREEVRFRMGKVLHDLLNSDNE